MPVGVCAGLASPLFQPGFYFGAEEVLIPTQAVCGKPVAFDVGANGLGVDVQHLGQLVPGDHVTGGSHRCATNGPFHHVGQFFACGERRRAIGRNDVQGAKGIAADIAREEADKGHHTAAQVLRGALQQNGHSWTLAEPAGAGRSGAISEALTPVHLKVCLEDVAKTEVLKYAKSIAASRGIIGPRTVARTVEGAQSFADAKRRLEDAERRLSLKKLVRRAEG